MFDGPKAPEALLKADFSKGEQFWKFWTTGKIRTDEEEILRFKIFSKRTADGRFDLVCSTELEDGRKVIWAEGYWETDAQLAAFIRGVQAAFIHTVGQDISFDMVDFSSCRTFEQWNRKMSESTTIRTWNSDDGETLKGEA